MKHSLTSFESEIVQQILISELCFEVCCSTFGPPGMGSHFIPYFYNLNYQKGIDSLHSLLLSRESNELSIRNYINLYKQTYPSRDVQELEKEVDLVAEKLRNVAPFSLRNKIGSHLDSDFTHVDFTRGYLMPEILDYLIRITHELKKLFFPFVNHALGDDPFGSLREQVYKILDKFTIEYGEKLLKITPTG